MRIKKLRLNLLKFFINKWNEVKPLHNENEMFEKKI